MKRKSLYILLGTEVVLFSILYLLADMVPTFISGVMAVPFEQIGLGLRWLSLCGGAANGLALALWAGISLVPLVPVFKFWQEKEQRVEHILLILLSVLLFVVLYYMTNPESMYKMLPEQVVSALSVGTDKMLAVMKAALSIAVWSVIVCYVVFRLLRLFNAGKKGQLFLYLYKVLYGLCGLFAGAIVISCMEVLMGVKTAQTAFDGAVTVVRALVSALPYVMDIIVILSALNLLESVLKESASEQVTAAAHKLSRICCITLAVVTVSVVGMNVLQLILSRKLYNINIHIEIPFMRLAFVLVALLFSRLIEENRKLTEENEMFI